MSSPGYAMMKEVEGRRCGETEGSDDVMELMQVLREERGLLWISREKLLREKGLEMYRVYAQKSVKIIIHRLLPFDRKVLSIDSKKSGRRG